MLGEFVGIWKDDSNDDDDDLAFKLSVLLQFSGRVNRALHTVICRSQRSWEAGIYILLGVFMITSFSAPTQDKISSFSGSISFWVGIIENVASYQASPSPPLPLAPNHRHDRKLCSVRSLGLSLGREMAMHPSRNYYSSSRCTFDFSSDWEGW